MIDDTLDVLLNIKENTKCKNLLWFTGDPNFSDEIPKRSPEGITIVNSWIEIIELCNKLLPSEATPDPTIDLSNIINKRTYKYD